MFYTYNSEVRLPRFVGKITDIFVFYTYNSEVRLPRFVGKITQKVSCFTRKLLRCVFPVVLVK